ncbi:M23 family metallopeptidase [Helicobacter pylori]|uniref:M23 family metallopeptidase n=1 Tax=Helicobacter pylori TaxID=210 RepID=UPI001934492A|nr:M23 family metallopeptidase [Helicobacter pylori]MBM0605201.1 M23 family metallopeptidase [Helicobacter pylori]MBM0612891.1 M23 family metallopeptidase [Helicobacter pylori]
MGLGFKILALVVLILGGYLIFNALITKPRALSFSLKSEENALDDNNEALFWDLKKPIKVKIVAPKGIKRYEIKVTTKDNLILYEKESLVLDKPKSLEVPLIRPEIMGLEGKCLDYEFQASDWSYANFFNGNKASFKQEVCIDTIKPSITILSRSPSIAYGGSAIVIFEALDKNLSQAFVRVKKKDFKAFRFLEFKQRNVFIALVPWPYENKDFKAFIVAKDKAYNSNTTPLLFKRKTHRLRERDIDLNALKDKVAKQEKFQNHTEQTLLEIFSNTRLKDLEKIQKIALEQGDFDKDFSHFQALKPLNGPFKMTSNFLENRRFLKDNQVWFKFLHLGVDLMPGKDLSLAFDPSVKRVFKGELDFYGNSLINCYGLGLCVFLAHLKDDKSVGSSGLKLGIGLHLGMLLQGVFVRPNEWLNEQWIKTNIITPIEQAKRLLMKG